MIRIHEKDWGIDKRLIFSQTYDLHLIEVDEGEKCSKHKHKFKFNYFYVISGQLRVYYWVYTEGDWEQKHIDIGDDIYYPVKDKEVERRSTYIKPGVWHQFEALTDVEAIEFYYNKVDIEDIKRQET